MPARGATVPQNTDDACTHYTVIATHLIEQAPLSERTLHDINELIGELPRSSDSSWVDTLSQELQLHAEVIEQHLLDQQVLLQLSKVRTSPTPQEDFMEILTLKRSGRLRPRFAYPRYWNELVVRYAQPMFRLNDFVGLDHGLLVPEPTRSWSLHTLVNERRVVELAYVLADYDALPVSSARGVATDTRASRYEDVIGVECAMLLFTARQLVLDFRFKQKRATRRPRPTTPS